MINPWQDSNDFSHIDRAGNDIFTPRTPGTVMNPAGATARVNDKPVLRAMVRGDGVIETSSDGPLRTSVDQVADAASRAAGMSYDFAVDHRTRTRLQPTDLTEDSILSYGGAEVTVRQAKQLGWFKPAGKSSANPTEASASQDEDTKTGAEQENSEPNAEAFADPSVDEAFTGIINATAPEAQLAAVTEIVSDGVVSEETLNALSEQMGVHPTELQSKFEPIMAHYEAQGRAAVEKAIPGVQSEAVFAWAREHVPDALNKVMRTHALERRTVGYEVLAQVWLEQLADTDPDLCLISNVGEGWSSRLNDKGKVIVISPQGKELPWREAMMLRRRV